MKPRILKRKWDKDLKRDTIREMIGDDELLDRLDRCPHIIRKQAGDETYDICELNTKACLIEHGLYECETWDEIRLRDKEKK